MFKYNYDDRELVSDLNIKNIELQKGLTGLQSLYNDSFIINSNIQCLSNTVELTDYFISWELKKNIITKHQNNYKHLLLYSYMKLIKQNLERK